MGDKHIQPLLIRKKMFLLSSIINGMQSVFVILKISLHIHPNYFLALSSNLITFLKKNYSCLNIYIFFSLSFKQKTITRVCVCVYVCVPFFITFCTGPMNSRFIQHFFHHRNLSVVISIVNNYVSCIFLFSLFSHHTHTTSCGLIICVTYLSTCCLLCIYRLTTELSG